MTTKRPVSVKCPFCKWDCDCWLAIRHRVANADYAKVSFRQSVNSEGAVVLFGAYAKSVQVTACVFSKSTN